MWAVSLLYIVTRYLEALIAGVLNVGCASLQTNSATQEVVVTWSDEHRSVFRYGWLLARSFRYAEQCLRARWNGRAAKLWKSNLTDSVLNVKFDEVTD